MDKLWSLPLFAAVIGLVVFAMMRSWRNRVSRDKHLSTYPVSVVQPGTDAAGGAFGYPGAEDTAVSVLYVSTTPEGEPLERLAVEGLGFRNAGVISVRDNGIVLALDGSDPLWIPANKIVAVGKQTVTIDRVVERDGLTAITWIPNNSQIGAEQKLEPAGHSGIGAGTIPRDFSAKNMSEMRIVSTVRVQNVADVEPLHSAIVKLIRISNSNIQKESILIDSRVSTND